MEVELMEIVEADLLTVRTRVLKKLKSENTKCAESYIDGMSDFQAELLQFMKEGKTSE